MRSKFPLFQSHIDLAHAYWAKIVQPGDWVIDATCGNGHDTLELAKLIGSEGHIWAIDLQNEAINATKESLKDSSQVTFMHGCHTNLPELAEGSVKLVVYNLGYLPGGNKSKTTLTESTLQSISKASNLVKSGGAISVTCYPGHTEGKKEQQAILKLAEKLNPAIWNICHHHWVNRVESPSLLMMQRGL